MPRIPVNPDDLPTEYSILDESLSYEGVIKELVLNPTPDKNGTPFFKLQVEVTEPDDFKGKSVSDNYIPIPSVVLVNGELQAIDVESMSGSERRRNHDRGVRLGRLLRSLAITETDWDADDLIGQTIAFSIRNAEYQGRITSRLNDYLLPA
jgi:hypothetical protein